MGRLAVFGCAGADGAPHLRRLLAEYQASHFRAGSTTEGLQEFRLMAEADRLAADLAEVTGRLLAIAWVGEPERTMPLTELEAEHEPGGSRRTNTGAYARKSERPSATF